MEPSATATPRRRAASAVEQKCSAVFLFFLIVISLMKQLQEDKEVPASNKESMCHYLPINETTG
jgi:hypothetical protein